MENLKAKSFDLRKDTVDIIVAGKGGHIGGDMSVIDTLMSLYFCQMNISPENMDDPNRDRFVLSKGHSVPSSISTGNRTSQHPNQDHIGRIFPKSSSDSPFEKGPIRQHPRKNPLHR